jgi:hypothetical protein
MSRTKKFLYNSISTAFLQIVTMIVGIIIPRIMLEAYGSEINGLVSSISQFISYFNLVEAGLAGAAIYSLYKPLAENNYKAINGIVSAAKQFYIKSGYIFVCLTLGLAFLYPIYVRTDSLSLLNVVLLVLILGANGALEFFTLSKYRVLLSADQKTYVISIATVLQIIANTLIIAFMAYYKVNIVFLRFVALFSIFLRTAILMIYVRMKYKYIDYHEKPNKSALNKRWDALFMQVLYTIHTGAPVIILTIVVRDLKLISVYTIFNMIIWGVNGVLSIFISGLSASFGDVIIRGEIKTLQNAYKEFEFSYYNLITVIYSITFITIMPFVRIYTRGISDINYNIPLIGFLFVLNGLLYNIKTPQGMLIISAGMYKETKWQTLIQGGIAVILGIILAPNFGIVGVLIGSIISNIYRDIDLLFFVPRYITHLRVRDTFNRLIQMFVSIIIVWIFSCFINQNPVEFFQWILYAIYVAVISIGTVITLCILFNKKEVKCITKRILSVLS